MRISTKLSVDIKITYFKQKRERKDEIKKRKKERGREEMKDLRSFPRP